MTGRLIFYEPFDDCATGIKMGTYYKELPTISTQYKNVIYLTEIEFQRSSFEINEFEEVDSLGISRQTGRTSIERVNIDLIVNSNLLSYFNSIGAHSVIQLEIFEDTTDNTDTTLYRVDKIELSDRTGSKQVTGQITLTLDIRPEIQTACCTEDLVILSDFLAYWDIDDDGTEDIDADANHVIGSLGGEFEVWQLYFEADGITPLASGNVEIIVKGVQTSGADFIIGTFNGAFGDLLSDSAKWTSTYNVWDYFNLADSIGHRNIVRFAKETFGFDKGFFGDETTDSAIDIEFFIAVNDSPLERVTLQRVYTILSSYINQQASATTLNTFLPTVNKVNQQSTLTAYDLNRTRLPDSFIENVTTFSLTSITPFRKNYFIIANGIGESYSEIDCTMASGLTSTQKKGANREADFSLGARLNIATDHTESVLSFGATKFATFFYNVRRQATIAPPVPFPNGWPIMGTLNTSGEWFQDGISQGFLDCNLGNNSRTSLTVAANTDVHTMKFVTDTSGGYEISVEFQWRLHPRY